MARKRESRAAERERLLAQAAAVDIPSACDVCVVGGGASGIVAAIAAAELGASVVVVERDLECGRTILATGNGRCNFANADLSPNRYNDPAFVAQALGASPLDDILGFFRSCGLAWTEEDGRLYPRSLVAASVRDVLLARLGASGQKSLAPVLACGREAVSVVRDENGWAVRLAGEGDTSEELRAASVVIACGGGARIADTLGLPVTERRAALISLDCEMGPFARLDGRRLPCEASLARGGEAIARERGEVLLREWGLSGIAVFDLSRHALPGDEIILDLVPELSSDEVASLLERQGEGRLAAASGLIDPQLARLLCELEEEGKLESGLAGALKALPFPVQGVHAGAIPQVTCGGLACASFDPDTLASRELPGLFACGEALDIDGACGGYNLAWAWKSGLVAGASAARAALP